MKKIILGIVVIAIIALALPYYGGYKTEQTLRQLAETQSTSDYTLTWQTYERSWFKSEAVLQVHYNVTDVFDEPVDLPFNVSLKHGPLLFSDIASIGWMQYQTSFDDTKIAEEITESIQLTESQNLFQGKGYMTLGGDIIFEEKLSAFTAENEDLTLDFKGVVASGKFTSSQQLDLTVNVLPITVEAIAVDGSSIYFESGKMNLFATSDYSQQIASGLAPATTTFDIEKIIVKDDETALKIENLVSDNNLFFTDSNSALQMTSNNKVGKIDYQDGNSVTDVTFNFSYDNFPISIYKAYLETASAENIEDPLEIFNEDVITEAFERNTGFTINEAAFIHNEAPHNFNLKAYLKKSDDVSVASLLQAPPLLISSIVLQAEVNSDKTGSEKLIRQQMETAIAAQLLLNDTETSVSEEELEAIIDQSVQQTLQTSLALGYFTDEGETYKATITFEDGVLLLNGNEIPLQALMQALN